MLSVPKHVKILEIQIADKLKRLKKSDSELIEVQQLHYDEVLEIYQDAFKSLIDGSITYSVILGEIKQAYENALQIRDERLCQFITQDCILHGDHMEIENIGSEDSLLEKRAQIGDLERDERHTPGHSVSF